jgi:hypothetical protein
MSYVQFSDREYAEIVASLQATRDRAPGPTPTIDSALGKLYSWAHPSGCEFLAAAGVDYWLLLGAHGDADYDEARYQAARDAEGRTDA